MISSDGVPTASAPANITNQEEEERDEQLSPSAGAGGDLAATLAHTSNQEDNETDEQIGPGECIVPIDTTAGYTGSSNKTSSLRPGVPLQFGKYSPQPCHPGAYMFPPPPYGHGGLPPHLYPDMGNGPSMYHPRHPGAYMGPPSSCLFGGPLEANHHSVGQRRPPNPATTTDSAKKWYMVDDEILRSLVGEAESTNWSTVAEKVGKTEDECQQRWARLSEATKGLWYGQDLIWTSQEDAKLLKLVTDLGSKWKQIASHLPGRSDLQCWRRWTNHLNPSITKEAWTLEEDRTILTCHMSFGNKWSRISKLIPGRY